jgi:hypothetical protein
MLNSIKKALLVLFLGLVVTSYSYSQEKISGSDSPALDKIEASGGETQYGEEAKSTATVVTFADLVASPETYEGKEIVVTGNVNDVCAKEGCWMVLGNGEKEILVKTLHVFVVPKDCYDNTAVVNGVFNVKEISEEQARHFNDESKTTKIKSEDIKGPQKMFVIKAAGIKLSKSEGKSGSEVKGSCCDKSKQKSECQEKTNNKKD